MPINPDRMRLYPGGSIHSKEWKAIRVTILERADHACEGTPQHPDCDAVNYEPHPETGSKVILTIAHMDWNETNNDHDNLKALCQRCHNKWDAPQRQKNAAKTRRDKSPQIDLVDWIVEALA
jgi:5-methylcytosine-specific restriction endonuclease McrA